MDINQVELGFGEKPVVQKAEKDNAYKKLQEILLKRQETADDFEVISASTCYFASVQNLSKINLAPFQLATGDILMPGDGFTRLGKKGCSYKDGISVSEGWVQYYIGQYRDRLYNYALFRSFHIRTREDAMGKIGPLPHEHSFIAYSMFHDTEMGYFGSNYGYHFFDTDQLIRSEHKMPVNLPCS